MYAQARLNAGLSGGGVDELVLAQLLALPAACVRIQNARTLDLEAEVVRINSAAMLPRQDRVFVQPAPHDAVTDARQRLDLNSQLLGERPEVFPSRHAIRDPPIDPERSVGAIG